MAEAVKISAFGGLMPRTHSSLLQDGMATIADNCRLKSGKLVPIRRPSLPDAEKVSLKFENGLASAKDAHSMFPWKHTMKDGTVKVDLLLFPGDVHFADGNIADDEYDRIFVTGETGVSYTGIDGTVHENTPCVYIYSRENNSIIRHTLCKDVIATPKVRLASEKDVEGATITFTNKGSKTASAINDISDPSTGDVYYVSEAGLITKGENGVTSLSVGDTIYYDGDKWCSYDYVNTRTTAYYTHFYVSWVDQYGYESELSAPSLAWNYGKTGYEEDTLAYNNGDSVKFEPIVCPAGAVKMYIYKDVTGNETESIQFVKEVSGNELIDAQLGMTITVSDEDAGETSPEIGAVPYDLKMMTPVPGSFYVAASDSRPHTVLYSEVDNPTSWPTEYQYDVHDNVVALGVTTNRVFVLTDGYPYVMTGTAPESMTTSVMSGVPAACVSPRGVCIFQNACYFVSNQGLYCIYNDADEGTLCKNITEKLITKEQWQALNPKSAMIGQYDGAIHMFFTLEDGTHKGLILDLAESAATLTTHDEWATCICTDHRTDDMYFVRGTTEDS